MPSAPSQNTAALTAIKCLGDSGVVTSIESTLYGTSTLTYALEYSTNGNPGSWTSAGDPSSVSTAGAWITANWTSLPGSNTLYWRLSVECTNTGTAQVRIGDFRAYNGSAEFVEGGVLQPVTGTTPRLELGISKDGGVSIAGSEYVDVLGVLQPLQTGGANDLFGATWTRNDVNSPNFCVVVRRSLLGDEDSTLARYLDTLALDVYYVPQGSSLVALERQLSTQKILLGKEGTPGTVVPVTNRLMTCTCNASPKGEWRSFAAQGDKLDTQQMLIREWTEATFDGYPTYDELGYFLNACFNLDAPSTIATGAYNHRWTFNARMANTIQTYSVQYGDPEDATHAHGFGYGFVSDFDIDFDRTKGDFKATMLGQAISDGITMTPGAAQVWSLAETGSATGGTFILAYKGARTTPLAYNATSAAIQTALQALSTVGAGGMTVAGGGFPFTVTAAGGLVGTSLPNLEVINSLTGTGNPAVVPTVTSFGGYIEASGLPILPGQISIYVGSTYSTLSASKLTRAFVSKLSYKAMRAPVWVLDSSQGSFAATIEPQGKFEITITVEADSNGMAFLSNARNGTQMYVRLLGTGPQIPTTTTNYGFQIDACAKISSLPPFSDKDGVYAAEYKFTIDHSQADGFSTFVNLINGIATY